MNNYIEIAYNQKEKPVTQYPDQLARYLFNRFHMKEGMILLDNGCGRGDFLDAFERIGLKVYGVDVVQGSGRSIIVDLNKDELPFPDCTFDVVFSKSVIEHVEKTEFYLSEMRRVLKEGGILILLVPDWETQFRIFYQDPTHIHPYTQKSINRILNMLGFKRVTSERFIQLPVVWKMPFLNIICKMLRAVIGPVPRVYKNKFVRFSCELMILGIGYR